MSACLTGSDPGLSHVEENVGETSEESLFFISNKHVVDYSPSEVVYVVFLQICVHDSAETHRKTLKDKDPSVPLPHTEADKVLLFRRLFVLIL